MTEYTPEKVKLLRAELARWKTQAEAASARLRAATPEDDWQGLWGIERDRVKALEQTLAAVSAERDQELAELRSDLEDMLQVAEGDGIEAAKSHQIRTLMASNRRLREWQKRAEVLEAAIFEVLEGGYVLTKASQLVLRTAMERKVEGDD